MNHQLVEVEQNEYVHMQERLMEVGIIKGLSRSDLKLMNVKSVKILALKCSTTDKYDAFAVIKENSKVHTAGGVVLHLLASRVKGGGSKLIHHIQSKYNKIQLVSTPQAYGFYVKMGFVLTDLNTRHLRGRVVQVLSPKNITTRQKMEWPDSKMRCVNIKKWK